MVVVVAKLVEIMAVETAVVEIVVGVSEMFLVVGLAMRRAVTVTVFFKEGSVRVVMEITNNLLLASCVFQISLIIALEMKIIELLNGNYLVAICYNFVWKTFED